MNGSLSGSERVDSWINLANDDLPTPVSPSKRILTAFIGAYFFSVLYCSLLNSGRFSVLFASAEVGIQNGRYTGNTCLPSLAYSGSTTLKAVPHEYLT